jgi:UDP-N-acetylmuramoyl-tripeptide--D-alanyl-D-alanine ligase
MKNFMANWLASLARQLIAKHNPKIIGITGSVGKTSTRDAVYAVVSTAFFARKGKKNFNNEFGLPLTIIGKDSGGRNIFAWLGVLLSAYWQLWFGSFPEVLVLEMGVDNPGDMNYLLSIARPDVAVLTSIGVAHYEFFKSQEAVAEEKGKLLRAVAEAGAAIINADNSAALALKANLSAKVITYGFNDQSAVKLHINQESFSVPAQSQVTVQTPTQNFEATIAAIGVPHISSCAAAIAVGLFLGIPVAKIQAGLKAYRPVKGRLNLLSGIKKTLIVDDTYNASPDSMTEALQILARMPHHYKVAVLGDMLELGEVSEQSHHEIGELAASLRINQLILVGPQSKFIAEGALGAGMTQAQIKWFSTSLEAASHVREQLVEQSAILVKGSQGMRMEKITKELLADPMSASNVLTRQYGKWLES